MKDNNLWRILDFMYEGIYFVDLNKVITYWNKGAEKISGYSSDEVLGRPCHDNILMHVDEKGCKLCIEGCPLRDTNNDGIIREVNIFLHHKQGHRVPVSIKTIPMYENDKIIGSVEIFVDTISHAYTNDDLEKYRSLAMKDQLTSLPNRRYIETYLDLKMKEYKSFNLPFALAFIDIDHFKDVNDTYGHQVGDEILKMVSSTFVSCARGNDLIGRWGGEEFLAVFTNCNEEALHMLTEKIRMLVENSSLDVDNNALKVTISIGASMVTPEDTIDSIVKRADDLMYQSKLNGRNQCTVG